MSAETGDDARFEACKAALCAEICENLGFDPSNLAFSPTFEAKAEEELQRLCDGVCGGCPILKTAEAMKTARLKAGNPAQ